MILGTFAVFSQRFIKLVSALKIIQFLILFNTEIEKNEVVQVSEIEN